MDKDAMVADHLRAGDRLLDQLTEEGIPVHAAAWVKPVDEDRWSLHVATPLVDERGLVAAYHEVYRVLRSLEGLQVEDSEVKLVGIGDRIALDLLEAQSELRTRAPQRSRLTSIGGVPVDGVYVYPPTHPKAASPKQSVLRFVLRAIDNPMTVMSRFNPHGKRTLNSKKWRGKEPRSCAVTAIRSRPHTAGSTKPFVFDIEVSCRPAGCITFTGGTKYDGWTALAVDRTKDGDLLDGHGQPLPDGHPPVYRRIEVYEAIDFNALDFGEFIGEFDVDGVKHVSYEYVMRRLLDSSRITASNNTSFVAPRKHRPLVKVVLSNAPSGTSADGFGTMILNINNSTPHLPQAILNHIKHAVSGFVEGRNSLKNMATDELVLVELDDLLVDCTPNEKGGESRFNCLSEYLPPSWLDELAMWLVATYDINVSVVEGRTLALLMSRIEQSRRT